MTQIKRVHVDDCEQCNYLMDGLIQNESSQVINTNQVPFSLETTESKSLVTNLIIWELRNLGYLCRHIDVITIRRPCLNLK